MKVEVARSAGFCFGVGRAVELAERAAGRGGRVVSLGPLVHNPQEVQRLRDLGVEHVEGEDLDGTEATVIVRSHGADAGQLERLRRRTTVEDATCPHVRACQVRAERMAAAGYAVVVVGDPGHPETESILSFARRGAAEGGPALAVAAPGRLQELEAVRPRRVAVVAQTTQDLRRLQAVAAACLERFTEVRVFNTICEATALRQAESRQLARRADLVVVVGGRSSANTGRLVAICGEEQPNTRWVERADELELRWLDGCHTVAVTAGASTPDRVIREVIDRLEQLGASMDHGGETVGKSR